MISNWSLLFIVTVFCLSVYSSEWVREYYLNNDDHDLALEKGIKSIRKETILGKSNNESMNRTYVNLDDHLAVIVERQIAFAKNQWNEFRNFFAYENILGGIDTLFDKIRFIIGNHLVDGFHSWKNYNNFCSSKMPYFSKFGFLDNDLSPALGTLDNFNYSGGFALDCRLRSIGANLGNKKPVVAIRLRRWNQETRVKPENLSIWISDDNKVFRKYSGKITFSNQSRAMTLDHLDIVGQFIKIHCDYKDDKFTFAENFNNVLEVYGPPFFQQN
jgi:hypothetical protein